MNLKLWLRYFFEPNRRSLCKISYLYSTLVDLDKYGKIIKRNWKKHREIYMKKYYQNNKEKFI